MNSNLKLLPAALLVAMLALAGCGGGSDDTPEPPPTPVDPVDDKLTTDTARANEMFAEIADARDDVSGYDDDAADALANAEKYSGMLTTVAVKGDSTVAQTNAQMVLDALDHMEDARDSADAILTMAEGYVTEATGLHADTPRKASLLKAANDLVGKAESVIEDIDDLIAEYDRRAFAYAIPENDDDERDPALVAKIVAEAINVQLDGTTALTAAPGLFSAPTNADELAAFRTARLQTLPSGARTWEMIFGSARVSVTGREWADVVADVTATPAPTTAITNAYTQTGEYMGIAVTIECDGTCSISDGTLVGDWTVEAISPTQKWTRTSTGDFIAAIFAEYGHWLNDDGDIQLYVGRGDLGTGTVNVGDSTTLDATATYNGAAAGMSVRDSNGTAEGGLASGAFTATVSLEAEFGGTPVVSGTIDGFEGGAHVNTAWVVTLEEMTLSGTTTLGTDGRTSTGRNVDQGYWSNASIGPDTLRPTSVYGAFDANFIDGEARGVYVAD